MEVLHQLPNPISPSTESLFLHNILFKKSNLAVLSIHLTPLIIKNATLHQWRIYFEYFHRNVISLAPSFSCD